MPDEDQKIVIPVPRRREVQPTDDVLIRESAEAVNVLTHVWDGEVSVTVIMHRRAGGRPAWATSAASTEELRHLLKTIKEASYLPNVRIRKNRVV